MQSSEIQNVAKPMVWQHAAVPDVTKLFTLRTPAEADLRLGASLDSLRWLDDLNRLALPCLNTLPAINVFNA